MSELIYRFIYMVANVHERIIGINDSGGYYFDDKQLHFIVVGLFGMALLLVLYPIFKLLAKTGHTMVITWLYVFTVVLVLCFAIEIGQWYSGTGVMEREDVAYGITGFLVMFLIFAVLRGLYHGIRALTKKNDKEAPEGRRYEYDEYPEGKHYDYSEGRRYEHADTKRFEYPEVKRYERPEEKRYVYQERSY